MRAAIYNPYLDSLGGGERYTMGVAMALAGTGYRVDVQWKSLDIREKLEKRFKLDLADINIVRNIKKGDGYDVCFWVSDGSIPLLHARVNFLHFQFPFMNVNGKTLINKMKFIRINKVISNSYFTKGIIDREYGINSEVIYPPVSTMNFRAKRKENIILYVGRFSQLTQAKNQIILVKAFKKFLKNAVGSWKLIIAGGSEVGAREYLVDLNKKTKGYPIELIENLPFKQMKDLYGKARIFWSAAGYQINEKKNPMKVEHFGISVVEAMVSKCIPVIYSAGGHREIVKDGFNGFLWQDIGELIKKTQNVISDKKIEKRLANKAYESSLVYGTDRFEQQFLDLL